MAKVYAALFAFMLPIVWIAAGTPAFQAKYPFPGRREPELAVARALRASLLLYLPLRRGLLARLLALRDGAPLRLARAFDQHGALCPRPLGKPVPEVLGAVVTAYALGYLALRHRSFWFGVALHFGVAFFMDVFALARAGQLPASF